MTSPTSVVPHNDENHPSRNGSDGGCLWFAIALLLVAALISPIDPVPDVIPVVGWTDDLAYIVGLVLLMLSRS